MSQEERKYTLKELRARKNETQEQTAKALSVSTQTYNSWEKNFGVTNLSKAKDVAEHFGVRIDDIFF